MMEHLNQQLFTGERALFKGKNLQISHSVFADGESPLKESNNIVLENTIFRWKYPLWYARNIQAKQEVDHKRRMALLRRGLER